MTKKLDRKSITSEKSVTAVSTPHSNSKIITRKTKKIIKSKYPVFKSSGAKDDLPGDIVIVPSSGSSKIKMAEDYTNFLQNICDKEKAELHKMFEEMKAENQSSAHSLQAIEDQLYSILDALPPRFHEEYLKTPTDSLIFSPELNPVERSLAEFKQKQLEIYNQFYQTLLQYEQDLGVLRQTENLWLGKIPADLNKNQATISDAVANTSQRYLGILQSIESACDKILDLCHSTKKQMTASRELQDQLYDSFEVLRTNQEKSSAANNVPKDSKDLIRGFPKLLK